MYETLKFPVLSLTCTTFSDLLGDSGSCGLVMLYMSTVHSSFHPQILVCTAIAHQHRQSHRHAFYAIEFNIHFHLGYTCQAECCYILLTNNEHLEMFSSQSYKWRV